MECVCNRVLPNHFVQVGLLREEVEALRQIARRPQSRRAASVGQALKRVLNAALLHWDQLEPHLLTSEHYALSEGFGCMEVYGRDRLAQRFPPRARKPRPKS